MTDQSSPFAGLTPAASMQGAGLASEPGEASSQTQTTEEETPMTEEERKASEANARAEAADEARAAANERVATIMASEHYAGREKLAATLITSSMSADEVVTALKAAGKEVTAQAETPAPTGQAANDAAAAAAMQNVLDGQAADDTPSTTAGSASGGGSQVEGDPWGKAYGKLGMDKKVA